MFRRFLSRASPARDPRVPDGAVVWAVGDVHGRADLLRPLIETILERADPGRRTVLVTLGDYVDRGPDSRGVLDLLCEAARSPGLELIALRGNHDDRMHAFLTQPELGPAWCEFGGRAALSSYGVRAPLSRADEEGWRRASAELAAALPQQHRAMLDGLRLSTTLGDYFFVHAGARPGAPLDQQTADDLMWIREPFLSDRRPFERIVVHGHTPAETPHLDHRRINLDTGAYATGVLTALRLEGAGRALLQVRSEAGRVLQSLTPA
ncbi:MAG: metallophosphoesterase family protein [Brevundimonas sp.]